VETYTPGKTIRFRFTAPRGFSGYHCLEITDSPQRPVILKHTIEMKISGWANITWPLFIRPLHDALLEDAFTRAQIALGLAPKPQRWSYWVRLLRWIMSHGKAQPQSALQSGTNGRISGPE
jgi:hypothetical protein